MDVPFDLPPDATLITGPAGSGKTAAAIDAILDARLFNPFSTIWVLLANWQQIHAFQERLIVRSPDAVQFGVEFFDFETLYLRLLDLLGRPQRLVEDTARFQILHHVATTLREVHSTNRHSWGAVAWINGVSYLSPTCELDVYDRVGGGDGFASGFFYGLLSGEPEQEAVNLGWAHGALLTTFPGDTSLATLDQVKAFAQGCSARIQR